MYRLEYQWKEVNVGKRSISWVRSIGGGRSIGVGEEHWCGEKHRCRGARAK